MASTLLSRTLLVNRFAHSVSFPSGKTQILPSVFSKKLFQFRPNSASVAYNPTRRFSSFMASSVAGAKAHFSSKSLSTDDPIVSPDWLHSNLKEPDLKVLDASWYMPDEQRNPIQEYQVAHIPGALFFDVDGVSDRTSKLPHMLPSEEAFAAVVSALGISNKDGVVVYDGKGLFSAARVWWMFRVFGHDRIWVLDGGLPKWRTLGYDVESSASGDAILKATAASAKTSNNSNSASAYPKGFNRTYQAKGRIADGKKWDHDGFDQLQTEQQSTHSRSSGSGAKTGEKEPTQSAKTIRGKRPDQQFYSVRQKQNMRQEELVKKNPSKIDGSERLNCSAIEKREDPSPYLQPIKDVLTAFGEKEMLLLEDDKVSVSNVSTALSDPQEACTKSEVLREGVNGVDISQSPKSTEPSDILFDLALEMGSELVNVRIYQGEEDYESVLDRICDENNVEFRTKLCLKINILLLIKEATANPEKIDAVLNKLLDKNYELIMNDKQPDLAEERSCGYSDKETLMESTLEISESSF